MSKNLGGRPKKEFNKKQFEQLCKIQCTQIEIATVLDMSDETLMTKCKEAYGVGFLEIYKKFSDNGKMSIRRAQLKKALEGNTAMLIWLGKQYLGQSDKQDQKVTFDGKLNLNEKFAEHRDAINRRFSIPL